MKKKKINEEKNFDEEYIVVCSKKVSEISYAYGNNMLNPCGYPIICEENKLYFTTMNKKEIEDFVRNNGEKSIVYISKNEKCNIKTIINIEE